MRRQWIGGWLALVMLVAWGCGSDDGKPAKARRLVEQPPLDAESPPPANAPAPDATPASTDASTAEATPGSSPDDQGLRAGRRRRRPAFDAAPPPSANPPTDAGPPPQGVEAPRLGAGILRALTGMKTLPAVPGGAQPLPAGTLPGQAAPPQPPEVSLLDQAKAALREGDERKGLDLLMADGVVRGHEEVLSTVRWSPGLKRPMLIVRCGLVVLVSDPASQTPTGSEPAPATEERSGRRGTYKSPARGGTSAQPAEEKTDKGDKSDKALTAFWDETVIQPLLERLKARVGQGAFGTWLKGVEAVAVAIGGSEPGTRFPGIVILSAAGKDEALQQAEKEGLDALFVATVAARGSSSRGPTQTSFSIRMYEPGKETELWASKVLNDMRLKAAKDRGKAVISEYVDEVMKQIEERLQLVDLPAISRDAAARRASALAAKKVDRPLPVLLELRLYESKKLLTPAELAKLYGRLVEAADATKLASGTPAERREAIARVLPTGTGDLSPTATSLPGSEAPATRRPDRRRRGAIENAAPGSG